MKRDNIFHRLIRANTRSPHPESPLRESAQYLVAGIFYKKKDWRGALAEFEALLAASRRAGSAGRSGGPSPRRRLRFRSGFSASDLPDFS